MILMNSGKLFLAIVAISVIGAQHVFPQADAPSSPPLPPSAKPPVDFFRELLLMSPAECERALKDRSPENKSAILAKVREYEALNPDERELRLRATELRWHLLSLMPLAATNRSPHLENISEPMRKLVEGRLATWDKLSSDAKEVVLKGESSLQRAVQVLTRKLSLPAPNAPKPSAEQIQKFEQDLARIRKLPAEQQKLIAQNFNQFFELKPDEKVKVLRVLSETERKEIERTLQRFARLPKEQQARCVDAVTKLAGMNADERRQFFENAERWQAMSPSERQAWRDLVRELPTARVNVPPPPTPPGLPVPVVSTNKRPPAQL